tara:strand:+ start:2546 stop:2800 length:255 start_codon:yes stop_codon:yes gene_type:complete
MGQERIYLSRWCNNCGVKLPNRNAKRTYNGYKVRNLCKSCWSNPTDEDRCDAITKKKVRCKLRKDPESKGGYCGMHRNKMERGK